MPLKACPALSAAKPYGCPATFLIAVPACPILSGAKSYALPAVLPTARRAHQFD